MNKKDILDALCIIRESLGTLEEAIEQMPDADAYDDDAKQLAEEASKISGTSISEIANLGLKSESRRILSSHQTLKKQLANGEPLSKKAKGSAFIRIEKSIVSISNDLKTKIKSGEKLGKNDHISESKVFKDCGSNRASITKYFDEYFEEIAQLERGLGLNPLENRGLAKRLINK